MGTMEILYRNIYGVGVNTKYSHVCKLVYFRGGCNFKQHVVKYEFIGLTCCHVVNFEFIGWV